MKSIAENFAAAAAPAGVGLIRGCSPRTDRLELGLLLVAQRCVEIVKHRTHQLDRLQHAIEPLADGGEPCRWRERIIGLARGFQHVRCADAGILEHGKTGALVVRRAQPRFDLLGRPFQRGYLRNIAALRERSIAIPCRAAPALIFGERIQSHLLFIVQQAIEPTEAQRAALDELANASVAAAQKIKAACPTTISLTAPSRLASMQQRIEAMIAGVAIVRPALDNFYGVLNDEQKARLSALAEDQRRRSSARKRDRPLAQACDVAQAALKWPAGEIETRLSPTDAQRAKLVALQDVNAKAADMLRTSCQPDDTVTPPARLDAIGKRLDTMLQAVKLVQSAVEGFYTTLSDEQKFQFEAIGPRRTASSDRPETSRRRGRIDFGN